MGKPEAKVEDYLRDRVKALGGQIRKVRWIGRTGAADELVWFQWPQVGLVECKAPGKDIDPRSSQGREFRRMSEAGWPIFVVSSKGDVDRVLIAIRLQK